jgi:hypothetical protein
VDFEVPLDSTRGTFEFGFFLVKALLSLTPLMSEGPTKKRKKEEEEEEERKSAYSRLNYFPV